MLLFRLLTTSLCVACVVMLATVYAVRVPRMDRVQLMAQEASVLPRQAAGLRRDLSAPVSVIDVADGVSPGALAALVHLQPDERVSAINDRALNSDLEAGAWIASRAPRAGEFLDLTVASETTERRVLVLMH